VSTPFSYRGGMLCAEAVPLDEIARAVGTPAYVYSTRHMRHQLKRFQGAFTGQPVIICYALKANSNLAVIKTLADAGAGAEIVSGGELQRALAVGVPPRAATRWPWRSMPGSPSSTSNRCPSW
jgi:diaminopimelate decarboxylase